MDHSMKNPRFLILDIRKERSIQTIQPDHSKLSKLDLQQDAIKHFDQIKMIDQNRNLDTMSPTQDASQC